MAKIYEWPNKQSFHAFLDDLKDAYYKGLTNSFICIYSRDFKEDKRHEGFIGTNLSFWFGESSTECLGLTDLMKQIILEYIADKNKD